MKRHSMRRKSTKRHSVATAKVAKDMKKAEKRKRYFTKEDQLSRIQKYEEQDKKNKYYKAFQGDPSFRGPKPKRKVTDRYFVPGFIVFNALFLIYGVFALKDGAIERLTHNFDFRSELCGIGKLESKPYVYYANAIIDANVKFCVEKCPQNSVKITSKNSSLS